MTSNDNESESAPFQRKIFHFFPEKGLPDPSSIWQGTYSRHAGFVPSS